MLEKKKYASYDEFVKTFGLERPSGYNFAFDTFDKIAEEHPERPALVHVDDSATRREVSFAELARASRVMAQNLADRGVKKGDRFMLILMRRIEFWITVLAMHRLGAVCVPCPSMLTPKDISYRVDTGKLRGAIVEDSVAGVVEQARAECPDSFEMLVSVGGTPEAEGWINFADLAQGDREYQRPDTVPGGEDMLYVFFTSGTTGPPKMVVHNHYYPLGHYISGAYWHNLRTGSLDLTVADTGWAKAQWGKMYGQWLAGASVFVYDFRGKFDPENLLQVMADNKVTSFCAPPTVYRFLIRQDLSRFDLSALEYCTTAGELLNDSVFEAWKNLTGLSIMEGYGQTETTLQIATFPFMTPKPGSIGRPVPGWNVTLLDQEGRVCPPGEEGEICLGLKPRPLGLFSEYLDEPERTSSVMIGDYYHTGDKAWMDEDGFIWFLGRMDDLIKSSGYRIGPFEVESALVSHEAVVEAAVTGLPDPVRGQVVKATVVLAQGFEPGEELIKELQNHVKTVTAPYKYPRVVEFVSELPKTISGKIKRAEIREADLKNIPAN